MSQLELTRVSHGLWRAFHARELRMALQFAMAVALGGVITVDDLPPEVREETIALPSGEAPGRTLTVRRSQRQALLEVLRVTASNVRGTSRRLGIARSTVYRMLERHDLQVNPCGSTARPSRRRPGGRTDARAVRRAHQATFRVRAYTTASGSPVIVITLMV